jgi:hypothetical protein
MAEGEKRGEVLRFAALRGVWEGKEEWKKEGKKKRRSGSGVRRVGMDLVSCHLMDACSEQ